MDPKSGPALHTSFPPGDRIGGTRADFANKLFKGILFLFVVSTLFDPADLLFGLKLPLYLACWGTGVLVCITRRESTELSPELVLYCVAMVALPLLSILSYQLLDGHDRFQGFSMLKAYLFISMAPLLYMTRTNLLPSLSAGLTLLAVAILALTALVVTVPILFVPIYSFGMEYRIFGIDERDYGGLVLFQMFFVTSSMLVVAAAYYFDRAYRFSHRRKRHWALMVLCLGAMMVAGSRNNIFIAIVLPVILAFLYSRRKLMVAGLISAGALVGIIAVFEKIKILLNPVEVSNQSKIDMLNDYAIIFDNPVNLWIGRGLGSYDRFASKGVNFVTELTYLEIIRNYGLVMGLALIILLIYPLIYGFVQRRSYPEKHLLVAYGLYLLMSATNPLLFSSAGILVLSVVLANIFQFKTAVAKDGSMSTVSKPPGAA
jgi:hypothetical protein